MTVALQRVSSKEKAPIHRVRVPFRVLVLYGLRFEIESITRLFTRILVSIMANLIQFLQIHLWKKLELNNRLILVCFLIFLNVIVAC